MSYQIIAEQQGLYPVAILCRALGVSMSGYCAWRKRGPSARQQRDAELLVHIRTIYRVISAPVRPTRNGSGIFWGSGPLKAGCT